VCGCQDQYTYSLLSTATLNIRYVGIYDVYLSVDMDCSCVTLEHYSNMAYFIIFYFFLLLYLIIADR